MTPDTPTTTPVCAGCGLPLPAVATGHGMCARCAWSVLDVEDEDEGIMSLPGLRIVNELARGGMGVVYRAIEAEAGRDVAVKMMQPAFGDEAEIRERFAQEARAMGALDHPGILPVYRVGDHHGLPFFTMKLAEGGTLAQRLARYANDWRGIAELMAHIADAVHHAHQRGLLHRDLKPQNILFDGDDRAYVSDFGLVKMAGVDSSLTRSVSVLGTPHYMAPEVAQRDARASSIASDVWSLGAILYELIAQRLAFQAEGVPALLRKIVEEEPAPLTNAPRDLATITMKCLHKSPAQRYASAAELSEDLQRWLKGEPITARPMGAAERLWIWCKRKPALAALSALLALSLIGGGALVLRANQELKQTLRASLINEARSVHLAARVQERDKGLEAVRRAAAMGVTQELEEEAASLLALPGVELADEFPAGRDWFNLVPDADLKIAADFTQQDGVRIVELPSRRELAKLQPGRQYTSSRECFSPDGELLAFVDLATSKLVICEWRTSRVLLELARTAQTPHFSPDGKQYVVGLADGSVKLFDLTHPEQPPREWKETGFKPALPLGFSPDGRRLVIGGAATSLMKVFDVATGEAAPGFGWKMLGSVSSLAWAGDGLNFISGTTTGKINSWAADTGGLTSRTLPGHSAQVYAMSIQPQGQLAVTSGMEGRSWLLDWPSGRAVGSVLVKSTLTTFSRDGRRLAMHDKGRGVLQLYDISSGNVCRQLVAPDALNDRQLGKGSWCAALRPDARVLAVVQFGKTNLFDVAGNRYLGSLPDDAGNTLAWTADGHELWIATRGQKIVRWGFEDQADGSILVKRRSEIALQGKAMLRLSLAEKADRWAITTENGVCFGSISKGGCTFIAGPPEFGAPMQTNPITLSPDGRIAIVSTEAANKLGVLDLDAQKWIKFFDCDEASYAIFSADGTKAWIANWTELWHVDCRIWEKLALIKDREAAGSYGFIDSATDGRSFITMDATNIILRNGDDGSVILHLRHPMPATAGWLTMTPDGRWIVLSGLGHISQVWDLAALQSEFAKLGIPWRGHDFKDAPAPRAVTKLAVE